MARVFGWLNWFRSAINRFQAAFTEACSLSSTLSHSARLSAQHGVLIFLFRFCIADWYLHPVNRSTRGNTAKCRTSGIADACYPRTTTTPGSADFQTMSAPLPNLAELPVEVLEQILIRLPGQDIVKMEAVRRTTANFGRTFINFVRAIQVNRHLRDLIHNFPALHHRRELFATGLIDNPRCPCDLAQRRRLRERHAHRWSNAVSMVETPLKSPPGQSAHWLDNANYLGNGLLAVDSAEQNSITFLHIPPVASRKPVEGWSIPPFTFGISGYAAYPPENVLAVAERREK